MEAMALNQIYHTHTCSFTPRGDLAQPIHLLVCLQGGRKLENPEELHTDLEKTSMQTLTRAQDQTSELRLST